MARFLSVALAAWLAIGACSAAPDACPLLGDSQAHHDCCPRSKSTSALIDCPYFVALKVAPVDAITPANAGIALMLAAAPQFTPLLHSSLQDRRDLYLSIGVLRI